MTTGRELARQGQDDTLAAATIAHLHYLDDVRAAFDWCIEESRGQTALWGAGFTAEDVRWLCLHDDTREWLDEHTNVLPAIFGAASRTNRIHPTGWTTPTRKSRHGNAIRTWRGTHHQNRSTAA